MKILNAAREKNKQKKISGMLVYSNREFMQILEGDEKIIKDLYQTIAMDSRHRSVEIFYQGPIEHRSFTKWSMAFKKIDQDSTEILASDFENFKKENSLMSMVKNSPNRGKKTFLSLLDTL